MTSPRTPASFNRRQWLRGGMALAGGVLLSPLRPLESLLAAGQQAAAPPADQLAASRAAMAAVPIETVKLTDRLTMLSGPGGNIVVLNGPDGKIVVDTFIQGVWDKLKQSLDALGPAPIKAAIDTHWHFDHSDNNAAFRKAGAAVIAHENTSRRMAQTHELLGMKFPPSPPEALPTQTFKDKHSIDADGDQVRLVYIPPAHTDTDIYIHFTKGNVLHLGDLFFNGMYPFIDAGTGGTINGMIAGVDFCRKVADRSTKIVPGHGPLADLAALGTYRDMLVTVRDRIQKLKTAGRTLPEVVAAKPLADLDATWGKGFMQADNFVGIVYNTL